MNRAILLPPAPANPTSQPMNADPTLTAYPHLTLLGTSCITGRARRRPLTQITRVRFMRPPTRSHADVSKTRQPVSPAYYRDLRWLPWWSFV
jgi:hypothetical protein